MLRDIFKKYFCNNNINDKIIKDDTGKRCDN